MVACGENDPWTLIRFSYGGEGGGGYIHHNTYMGILHWDFACFIADEENKR